MAIFLKVLTNTQMILWPSDYCKYPCTVFDSCVLGRNNNDQQPGSYDPPVELDQGGFKYQKYLI